MKSRMEKHMEGESIKVPRRSRVSKNNHLYDEINNRIGYEEIVNLDTQTRIDLSSITKGQNREEYQKLKDYQEFMPSKEEKAVEYIEEEKKNYDINSILEDAKKNRIKYDELERKRKLRENDYVTLADKSELEMNKEIKNGVDEKELTDLINTITSHNLLEDIKKAEEEMDNDSEGELLSELMATNANLNIEEGIAKEFVDVSTERKIDDSFYTKSMDLSEQDFELSDEIEKESRTRTKIIIVIVIILVLLFIVGFFILKQKGII